MSVRNWLTEDTLFVIMGDAPAILVDMTRRYVGRDGCHHATDDVRVVRGHASETLRGARVLSLVTNDRPALHPLLKDLSAKGWRIILMQNEQPGALVADKRQ